MEPVTQFAGYTVDITISLYSSYFMTIEMHRFAFLWLIYSRNKVFRVGPNISEKFVMGEPILGGSKLNVTVSLGPLLTHHYLWSLTAWLH